MKSFFDLWSWNGTVSRRAYLFAGLALTAFKYPLDLLVSVAFDQPWSPLMYFTLRVSPLFSHALPHAYLLALGALSLPFLAAGISLSARRLRDMGVHPLWCGLLLLPLLHWVFILVLVVCPPWRPRGHAPEGGPYRAEVRPQPQLPRIVTRVMPESEALAFLLGLLFSVWLGAACLAVAFQIDKTLGGGLFIGTPFGMGFIMGFSVCYRRTRSVWTGAGYGIVPCGVGLLILLVFAWEGVACILMAAVIVLGMSALGGMVGAMVSRTDAPAAVAAVGILVGPALLTWDHVRPPSPASLVAHASIVVRATPEAAFRALVSPARYDAPPAPVFAIVAMPLETRAEGPDPGAARRCVFTNGEFVTKVASWDEPREVSFVVEKQPAQLDHILTIDEDRLSIEANADGTSTVRSAMRYRLRLHPAGYWGVLTNALLGAIHARVLEDVRRRSEHPGTEPAGPRPEMPAWMEASNATCTCTRHERTAEVGGAP